MSCSICFNDPPEKPVLTVDGSIYCLDCISKWFELGKSTSPTTNLQIPKILIPATTLCQLYNLPVTVIPPKFTGVGARLISENQTVVTRVIRREIIDLPPLEQPPEVLRTGFPTYSHLEYSHSREMYNSFVRDVTKLYNLIIQYCGSFDLNDPKFLFHEFKFQNQTQYTYNWYNYRSRREQTCPIALVALLKEANFDTIENLVKPKVYIPNYFFRYFIELIPLKLVYNRELIKKGVDEITLRTKLYRKCKKYLTKYELINIIHINKPELLNNNHIRLEWVNSHQIWLELYKIITDEKIKVNVEHWYSMYTL